MAEEALLLAIESSTRWLSAALFRGERLVETQREEASTAGAERLLPLVDQVLQNAGITVDAVQHFAVSVGPGSFTGLRVGIATVKGLAFGRGPVVAPVSTLEALAHGAGVRDGVVVAALDAHRGELYVTARRFAAEREAETLVEAQVLRPDALAAVLPADPGTPLTWIGDAPDAAAALARPVDLRPPPEGAPDAVWIGRLGLRQLREGRGVTPEALAPRYLRRAEAEALRVGSAVEPGQTDV